MDGSSMASPPVAVFIPRQVPAAARDIESDDTAGSRGPQWPGMLNDSQASPIEMFQEQRSALRKTRVNKAMRQREKQLLD